MSNGLFSGVSGLALGTGLYRDVSGLWSGASGLIAGFGGWTPAVLFAQGEQGAWYDPSDFSTLFQDSAGTTPVTATGQTVGLVLDKSQGLVLGPEIVVNGDFSSGFGTGWTNASAGTGSASISGGQASVTSNTSANPGYVVQSITTVVGRSYLLTWQVVSGASAQVRVGNSSTGTENAQITNASIVSSAVFVATATTTFVTLANNNSFTTSTYDNISVKELPGNHARQSSLASKPILQQDAGGYYYLLFDGSDDFLVTNTITPGIDKAQVFAGVRKLSDVNVGMIVESSPNRTLNDGAFSTIAPINTNADNYGFASKGTAQVIIAWGGYASPITNVLTGIGDIAGDTAILRVNGIQAATSASDQGTGNYLAYPLYIGRRGGTTLPFNGRIYQMVVRFGANLPLATIQQAEGYTNSKTGAY